MTDQIKLLLAGIMVVAGIVGFYVFADALSVLRVLMVIAGIIGGVAIAWHTTQGQQLLEFGHESIKEARKVVWPSRKETIQTTGIVFAFVVLMAIFLWVVDASLLWAVKWLMGRSDT